MDEQFTPDRRFPWGQRVKVRLSEHCQDLARGFDPARGVYGHDRREDGRRGTVSAFVAKDDLPARRGHRYFVTFDEPILLPVGEDTYMRYEGRAYAPSELVPLIMPLGWQDDRAYMDKVQRMENRIVALTAAVAAGVLRPWATEENLDA